VAQVLAAANRKAKELGVDARMSLITARAAFGERRLAVTGACADARDYVWRRGDLMIDINPANADIGQILRGQ